MDDSDDDDDEDEGQEQEEQGNEEEEDACAADGAGNGDGAAEGRLHTARRDLREMTQARDAWRARAMRLEAELAVATQRLQGMVQLHQLMGKLMPTQPRTRSSSQPAKP